LTSRDRDKTDFPSNAARVWTPSKRNHSRDSIVIAGLDGSTQDAVRIGIPGVTDVFPAKNTLLFSRL
jgi:hypothetical protein